MESGEGVPLVHHGDPLAAVVLKLEFHLREEGIQSERGEKATFVSQQLSESISAISCRAIPSKKMHAIIQTCSAFLKAAREKQHALISKVE